MKELLKKKGTVSGEFLKKDFLKNYQIYVMMSFGVVYFIIFHYLPMFGIVMAFQEFNPAKGFLGSKWVGFKHIIDFVTSPYFPRLLRNTLLINVYQLIFVLLGKFGLDSILTGELMSQFSFVGYAIIMAIGLNFILHEKIKTANMLPSMFVPIIWHYLVILFYSRSNRQY